VGQDASVAALTPLVTERPPLRGVHPVEWLCELAGTALLLGGLSAVCLDFGPHTPLAALPGSPRLLITGLLFAGTGSLLAISPLGRRSGAHLNPVVTLAFFTRVACVGRDRLDGGQEGRGPTCAGTGGGTAIGDRSPSATSRCC